MSDEAIYVTFTQKPMGTLVVATRGYRGPVVSRLQWERKLDHSEEVEIQAAILRAEWLVDSLHRMARASLGDDRKEGAD